ncbi:nucleotide sugar dehydrogenase [Halovenus sp. HT40]|uniref:nucleotide sugar dehydrogenase n=1 Tax=Halovenus sp. HT40 TaxID=3126691 RepID=UPI00300F048A
METDGLSTCVIGQGYVGLTLTSVMVRSGYDVLGVEKDPERLQKLQAGEPHFEERGLEETIQSHQSMGRLRFRQSLEGLNASEYSIYIIAVGSPLEGGKPDTSALESAVDETANVVEPGDTVIIRSTISVGTADRMLDRLITQSSLDSRQQLYYLQAPERTVQGDALAEIRDLPQIVGGYNEASTNRGAEIFSEISDVIIDVDSLEAAEMIKLFDNTYRDINIAIGNAFGQIARQHGLDGQQLIKLANSGYGRNNIKQPGAGVGGGCLPKDPYLLIESMETAAGDGLDSEVRQLIETGRQINESMPEVTLSQANEALQRTGRESNTKTLVLGVAFKGRPTTNDTRNTPAEPVIEGLSEYGTVDAYDPDVEDWKIESLGANPVSPDSELTGLFEERTYDLVALLNNNPAFEDIDLYRTYQGMAEEPIIVDGWDVFPTRTVIDLGFHYEVVGGVSYDPTTSDTSGE